MDLIEYMQSVGCPLQPYQESVIRELMKKTAIRVVTVDHCRYEGIHLSDKRGVFYDIEVDPVRFMRTVRMEYNYAPPVKIYPGTVSLKSINSGPHWVRDKHIIPTATKNVDVAPSTLALLSRLGV